MRMRNRALIITEETRAAIRLAIERARAKAVPWSVLKQYAVPSTANLKLSDRRPGSEAIANRAENVLIPRGYRAAISFEEQPAGLMRHLSVSVDTKGNMPSAAAVDMLLEEFGFDIIAKRTSRLWVEEFDPGHEAINIVQIDKRTPEGHA
jgi:hypothetical protein